MPPKAKPKAKANARGGKEQGSILVDLCDDNILLHLEDEDIGRVTSEEDWLLGIPGVTRLKDLDWDILVTVDRKNSLDQQISYIAFCWNMRARFWLHLRQIG